MEQQLGVCILTVDGLGSCCWHLNDLIGSKYSNRCEVNNLAEVVVVVRLLDSCYIIIELSPIIMSFLDGWIGLIWGYTKLDNQKCQDCATYQVSCRHF